MIALLSFILGIILGVISVPIVIYLRARKSGWYNSDAFRVLCHLALHPNDFSKIQYNDGKKTFWYSIKD